MSTAQISTAHGKSLTMRQWAKELNLPQKTLRNRLDRGWTPEATFTPGKQLHRGGTTGSRRTDHTGERHGMLVVDHCLGSGPDGPKWLCVCDCGKTRVVLARNLRGAYSCGCKARRKADRRPGHPQPCWTCRNYAGGCSWSQKYPEPVKGWDATPTTKYQGNAGEVTSFAIHYCPEYVPDGTEVLMNG